MREDFSKNDDQIIEFLSFHVGDDEYSIDIMSVREIRGWTKATPLPYSPNFVRGVINLRGNVLPIFDLATRLGLPAKEDSFRNVIIVVQVDGKTIGLLVSAVSDILAISRNDLQPPPELTTDTSPTFIQALTIHEGRMIRVLNLATVTPSSEGIAA